MKGHLIQAAFEWNTMYVKKKNMDIYIKIDDFNGKNCSGENYQRCDNRNIDKK